MPVKKAFCTTCQRQVQVVESEPSCPVCSSPLIEMVDLGSPAGDRRVPSELLIG